MQIQIHFFSVEDQMDPTCKLRLKSLQVSS